MDSLTALSVISSLLAFTSSALVISQVILRGDANTKSLTEELEVVELILTECIQSLDSHTKSDPVPPSIVRCLKLCEKKRNDAIEIMEKIHGKPGDKRSRFIHNVRFAILSVSNEQPLIARFNSFRDTVMLLRDLTSDFRIESRIIQLSSAMTLLLNEERELNFDEDAISTTASAEMNRREDHLAGEESHHEDGGRTPRPPPPPPPRARRDANRFFFNFLMLQKFDFTRDIVVLIERAGVQGADMYEHIPVRNILDSGSEESFISRKILTDHSMDPAKIRPLSEEEQRERTIRTISGSPLTITDEVTLYWHRLNDTKQRRARFLVLDNEDVDVIIGSALWSASEGPGRRGYLALPGSQKWSERRRTKKAEKEKIQEAWATIRRQKEEATGSSSGATSSAAEE